MHDDLDLRVIERDHEPDPQYRAELRRRLTAILDDADASPAAADAIEEVALDLTAPRPARPDHRRRWVLGATALAVAAAATIGIVVSAGDDTVVPSDDSVPTSTTARASSGGMWPQSNVEEVRAAQARADAGDPEALWQSRAHVAPQQPFAHVELEVVDRFIRTVLGWESYRFNEATSGEVTSTDAEGWPDGSMTDQRYLRCATTGTNRFYPGESCVPTLDDRTYESVSLDLAQLDRQGREGIWVVSGWRMNGSFAQVDPAPVQAQAQERLEQFLAARVAGKGAEGFVSFDGGTDFPLLYATTAGAPYERYEIDSVAGPWWPSGGGIFLIHVFAGGGATVVQQKVQWFPMGELRLVSHSTEENGQSIVVSHTSDDNELTVSAPDTWASWLPGKGAGDGGHEQALEVWFGGLWRPADGYGNGERIEFVDPVAYDAWCAKNDGSPLLSAPADAAAIAQQLIADPNFETTAPVAARVGGLDAISMDVALAPGGKPCGVYMIDISRWIHGLTPGTRLRLYLVDLPEGMSVKTLAITVVASDDRFEAFLAEAAPIIESIEFHPR